MTPTCRRIAMILALGCLPSALLTTPGLATGDDEKNAETCAEAAERYKELTGTAQGDEEKTTVLAYKYIFCPAKFEVKAGVTVRWVNVDKRTSHSVWFKDAGRAESERFFPDETVEQTLDLPAGDHTYLCGPHWEDHGMKGVVTIVE